MKHCSSDIIALDWDGVISHFPEEMRILAQKFSQILIITLNRTITLEHAERTLQTNNIIIETCPDDRRDDYAAWKADICKHYNVALMLDDDGYVVLECRSRDIPTLAVNASFVQTALFDSEF